MISTKQIGYLNYLTIGDVCIRLDKMDGLRWDTKSKQVIVMASGGKFYETGFTDKEAFDEYITVKPKTKKKTTNGG
jgi:hypothetical protein